MAKLSVYDPPMCCSTGVCGPDGDDQLAQFASALDWARKSGAAASGCCATVATEAVQAQAGCCGPSSTAGVKAAE